MEELGCGLVAGIFFAFSTFVIGSGPAVAGQAIAAMQAINAAVLNRWFFAHSSEQRWLALLIVIPRC